MTLVLGRKKKKKKAAIKKNSYSFSPSKAQSLPVKFPPITYGMTPPGHILSVRDVAALGKRFFSFLPENFTVVLPLDVLFCSKPVMIIKTLHEITHTKREQLFSSRSKSDYFFMPFKSRTLLLCNSLSLLSFLSSA